jgi:hypothetical protein
LLHQHDIDAVTHVEPHGRMLARAGLSTFLLHNVATQHLRVEERRLFEVSNRQREAVETIEIYTLARQGLRSWHGLSSRIRGAAILNRGSPLAPGVALDRRIE